MTDGEVYRYRLEQAERRVEELEKLTQALDRALMKNRLDEYEIAELKKVTDGLGKKLDVLQEEWPTVLLFRDRVSKMLATLLTAFTATIAGVIIWAIKQGAV